MATEAVALEILWSPIKFTTILFILVVLLDRNLNFKSKVELTSFIEWEEVYADHFYGTLRSEIERIWANGKHVIFDVDVQGGINLKKYFKDIALSVFVEPPSIEALEQRLRSRKTETEKSIERRVGKAGEELIMSANYDHIIVNDVLGKALLEAERIVGDFVKSWN